MLDFNFVWLELMLESSLVLILKINSLGYRKVRYVYFQSLISAETGNMNFEVTESVLENLDST